MQTRMRTWTTEVEVATVAILATLDTKGAEAAWLRSQIEALGATVHVIDVGVSSATHAAETSAFDVATAAGTTIERLRDADDRGQALAAMGRGAAAVIEELRRSAEIDAMLATGGSGGSSIAAAAMQALPLGFPKLLVSTMASGDVSSYVGTSDACVMYSVADISGINRISRSVLGNAVAAVVGMAERYHASRDQAPVAADRRLIGASMFGVTTPAVDACRTHLEEAGYEVLVFHATGAGGRTLERLIADGMLHGVLDLTTTELADELVGGVLSAGPDRLTGAGRAGVPQVVSVGALDMVNFGVPDAVPARFRDRRLYEHNSAITLMRTTVAESAELGRIMGNKLAAATGPTAVVLPLRGVSALDRDGGPFADEAANHALFTALRDELAGSRVEVVEYDGHINDVGFAELASATLLGLLDQRKSENR